MIRAGWSAKRVQVGVGHSDPAFTLRVYGHLFPDELDSGRVALDSAIANLVGHAQATKAHSARVERNPYARGGHHTPA
jgi:hypothetical protein